MTRSHSLVGDTGTNSPAKRGVKGIQRFKPTSDTWLPSKYTQTSSKLKQGRSLRQQPIAMGFPHSDTTSSMLIPKLTPRSTPGVNETARSRAVGDQLFVSTSEAEVIWNGARLPELALRKLRRYNDSPARHGPTDDAKRIARMHRSPFIALSPAERGNGRGLPHHNWASGSLDWEIKVHVTHIIEIPCNDRTTKPLMAKGCSDRRI